MHSIPHPYRRQDTMTASVVGGLGCVAALVGLVLPYVESALRYDDNTIAQSDPLGAALVALLAAVVGWRLYRAATGREKPLWVIVPGVGLAVLAVIEWSTGFTLYPVLPDGSVDLTQPVPGSAGIGLYVLAFGVVLVLGAGIALWRIGRQDL